jgi:hypothetical protein
MCVQNPATCDDDFSVPAGIELQKVFSNEFVDAAQTLMK